MIAFVVILNTATCFAENPDLPAAQAQSSIGGSQEDEAALAANSADNVVWRSARVCGCNCLYIMLREKGIEPDYLKLRQELLRESFTSLTQLQEAGEKRGLACRMGKTNPQGLRSLPKPLIAHLDRLSGRGQARGHYVLVLAAHEENLTVMDGTSGIIETTPWRTFQRRWSGYVLYVDEDTHFYQYLPTGVFLLAGGLLAFAVERNWARRHSSAKAQLAAD